MPSNTPAIDEILTKKMSARVDSVFREDSVYIARRPTDGTIKIGVSHYPHGRMSSLGGRGNELLAVFDGGGRRLESELHYQFRVWALPGETEWFHPSAELMLFVDRIQRGQTIDEALETAPYPFQVGISVAEFFALKLPGCTKTAAAIEAGMGSDTLSKMSLGRKPMRPVFLKKLARWSKRAGKRYGYCIAGGTL